jgi:phage tail-like protein
MPKFTIAPQGDDPYKNLKFRIKIDSKYVAGLSKGNLPEKAMEVADRKMAVNPNTIRKSSEKRKSEAIILTAGMTLDRSFQDWANIVNEIQGNLMVSMKNYRKNIIIDVFNEANQKTMSYRIYNCWVSEYRAVPNMDAGANVVNIQTIKLENEGWERI